MADNVLHFIDPAGLAYYHGAKVTPIQTSVTTLQGYFNAGAAKNAEQLAGHTADYFATKAEVEAAASASTWKSAVADAKALKALKAPADTETRALLDTNAIYQFNDSATDTEDKAPNVYVADDGTKGAWVLLSHMVYSTATSTSDGLMSAADKAKLDGTQTYTQAEKDKVNALPAIKSIGSGMSLDEKTGELTATGTVVDLTPYAKTADMNAALAGKVDAVEGKGLSTNDYDAASKAKVDGLANIKAVGAGLALDDKTGTLTGTYSYTLPAATADALGGVKVGSGITLGDDGTISVSIPETQSVQAATNDMIDAAFNNA